MNKDEALNMEFEEWFENQYKHKPMPNPKQGDEPHTSVYMTMFADGAWKGWKACKEALASNCEALEQPAQEVKDTIFSNYNENISKQVWNTKSGLEGTQFEITEDGYE